MTGATNECGYTLAEIHQRLPAMRHMTIDKMPPPDFIGADGQPRWTQATVVGLAQLRGILDAFPQRPEPRDGPLMRVIKKGMPGDRTP